MQGGNNRVFSATCMDIGSAGFGGGAEGRASLTAFGAPVFPDFGFGSQERCFAQDTPLGSRRAWLLCTSTCLQI